MNKKLLIGIVSLIILAGIIITCTLGFNVDLIYSNHKEIDIYLGKEFENKEIKDLVKEVIGNEKVIINKVELYEDMVSISVKDISDEKITELNTKINEKYEIENKKEDLIITEVANTRIRDLVKPYIVPMIISFAIILVYVLGYITLYVKIKDKKVVIKMILDIVVKIVLVQALYFSIISITRIPFNRMTIPFAIVLYIMTTVIAMYKLDKNKKISKEEK